MGKINIIGIQVPNKILEQLLVQADKDKGPIPNYGTDNGKGYIQNLVKFLKEWRLYINTTMLKRAPTDRRNFRSYRSL